LLDTEDITNPVSFGDKCEYCKKKMKPCKPVSTVEYLAKSWRLLTNTQIPSRVRPYWKVLIQTVDSMLDDQPSAEAEVNRRRAVMLHKKIINALNFKGTDSELVVAVRLNKSVNDGEVEVEEEGVEGESDGNGDGDGEEGDQCASSQTLTHTTLS